MRAPTPNAISRWLRALAADAGEGVGSDPELLQRFIHDREETAFLSLLRRHGPMVLGVCRRLLPDPHAVEDAFQATFLVLLQRGAAVSKRELLANWLYGVAYRVCMQARRSRRGVGLEGVEPPHAREPGPAEAAARHELERLVDEEIQRLPGDYRRAVVLCYLQGQSYPEAARQLGCPPGTVATWLARARQRLRVRLGRRGLAVPAGLLGTLLAADRLSAAVPAKLAQDTLAAACSLAGGHAGAISTNVLALARGVSPTALRTKLGLLAVLLLCLSAGGGYMLTSPGFPKEKATSGQPHAFGPGQTPQAENQLPGEKVPKGTGLGQDTPLKVRGFTAIALTGAGKAVVRQTGKDAVWVKGPRDLVQASSARVENGTLVLRGTSAGTDVEFVVEVKDLRGLILAGVGRMEVTQVRVGELAVTVGGTGDLSVSGKADALRLTVAGGANFLGRGLTTRLTTVEHTGLGKALVHASERLEVRILGNGSVEYTGSPQVRRSVLGLGTVTKKR
jgi:RNA polymerase sigma factor (sigma-70 family)